MCLKCSFVPTWFCGMTGAGTTSSGGGGFGICSTGGRTRFLGFKIFPKNREKSKLLTTLRFRYYTRSQFPLQKYFAAITL